MVSSCFIFYCLPWLPWTYPTLPDPALLFDGLDPLTSNLLFVTGASPWKRRLRKQSKKKARLWLRLLKRLAYDWTERARLLWLLLRPPLQRVLDATSQM